MRVRIKRIDPSLPLPQYETSGAVAFDFVVRTDTVIPARGMGRAPSNVAVEIPAGYMLWVTDRSSTLKKTGLLITEGVIDRDFCGDNDEILLQFYNPTDSPVIIKRGDRVAQAVFLPVGRAEWEEVLATGNAGRGGFGSTDNRAPVSSIPQSAASPQESGKFIVIDGIDGSGKGTQTDLLIERLRAEGHAAVKADFPQYGKKSAGLVENYLNGAYGTGGEVSPYVASFFFMLDRYDASFGLAEQLEQGKVVVANRYVSANMGHQGAKFRTREARQQYFEWLDQYEYGVFGIPRPDLTVVLHVPAQIGQLNIDQKAMRAYLSGATRDVHEDDVSHLEAASQTYREMCALFPGFKLIECAPDGRLLSIPEVHGLIWEQVRRVLQ